MAKHVDRIPRRPESYTLLTLPRSFIGAPAQRATEDLARYNKSSPESDLARWEGEGGAGNPRTPAPKTLRKLLTMKFAMSGRPGYDSSGPIQKR